ncbi:MAG: hypothetical protein WCE54_01095 [Ignavibacteriaceae bacterium]
MKKQFLFLLFFLLVSSLLKAQSSPVMYFCERYDQEKGEIGINDTFPIGDITVMVKSSHELGLKHVHIRFDMWDTISHSFNIYKKFNFTINPDMKYVFFSENDESDMKLDKPGFYKVYLLNDSDKVAASAIVQILK